jgi:hypothetical protein
VSALDRMLEPPLRQASDEKTSQPRAAEAQEGPAAKQDEELGSSSGPELSLDGAGDLETVQRSARIETELEGRLAGARPQLRTQAEDGAAATPPEPSARTRLDPPAPVAPPRPKSAPDFERTLLTMAASPLRPDTADLRVAASSHASEAPRARPLLAPPTAAESPVEATKTASAPVASGARTPDSERLASRDHSEAHVARPTAVTSTPSFAMPGAPSPSLDGITKAQASAPRARALANVSPERAPEPSRAVEAAPVADARETRVSSARARERDAAANRAPIAQERVQAPLVPAERSPHTRPADDANAGSPSGAAAGALPVAARAPVTPLAAQVVPQEVRPSARASIARAVPQAAATASEERSQSSVTPAITITIGRIELRSSARPNAKPAAPRREARAARAHAIDPGLGFGPGRRW